MEINFGYILFLLSGSCNLFKYCWLDKLFQIPVCLRSTIREVLGCGRVMRNSIKILYQNFCDFLPRTSVFRIGSRGSYGSSAIISLESSIKEQQFTFTLSLATWPLIRKTYLLSFEWPFIQNFLPILSWCFFDIFPEFEEGKSIFSPSKFPPSRRLEEKYRNVFNDSQPFIFAHYGW